MDLSLESSVAVDSGLLFSTGDGGATWRLVPKAPAIAAAVRFVTPKDGWMAGGGGGQLLYSTHDRGKTWTRIAVGTPPQLRGAGPPSYEVPTFTGPQHGALAVSYPTNANGALALFTTRDAGRSWTFAGSLTDLPPVGTVPAVAVDSELLAGWVTHRTQISLNAVGTRGRKRTTVGAIQVGSHSMPAVNALSFRDADTGWVLAGSLYATTDGGVTWTNITPKATAPMRHVILKPTKPHRP